MPILDIEPNSTLNLRAGGLITNLLDGQTLICLLLEYPDVVLKVPLKGLWSHHLNLPLPHLLEKGTPDIAHSHITSQVCWNSIIFLY